MRNFHRAGALLLIGLLLLTAACDGPTPHGADVTPQPGAEELAAFITGLQARGFPARVVDGFEDVLLGGQGFSVCVAGDTVTVSLFGSTAAALTASERVDRADPSHVGNGIVEWIGPPHFWLRRSMVVNYVGINDQIIGVLEAELGLPFAVGQGGRGGRPFEGPSC